MRIQGTFYFEKYPVGSLDFPTTDGRKLRFDSQRGYKADYAYELKRLPAETDDFPIDGVALRIWVADDQGRVWSAVSQFTAEFFVDELGMCNFENVRDYYVFDKAPAEIQNLFQTSQVVEGIYFTSDDRFYRSLRVGTEWVQAIFKYTDLTFDVAVQIAPPFATKLFARLRQGSGYDPSLPLSEIRHTSELPELVFELGGDAPRRMLYANGAMHFPRGSWGMGPLPQPIAFESTGEPGEPQATITIVSIAVG